MSKNVENKELWKKAKRSAIRKYSKDGESWDARVSSQAIRIYKKLGGTYKGNKDKNNSMSKWLDENWMYHPTLDPKKEGRYLPKIVWSELNVKQARETIRNKKNGKTKRVKYEPFVVKALKKHNIL